MRFAAAALVFLTHASLFLYPFVAHPRGFARLAFAGPTGVGFFFVLSGFVLAWAHQDGDRTASFWRRRAARILPNHLLSWTTTLAILVLVDVTLNLKGTVLAALLLHAWVPEQSVIGAVDTPSWSLSVEVFFYALFPLVLAGARRLRPATRPAAMAALCAVPLVAALTQPQWAPAFEAASRDYLLFTFPPTRLAEFALGVLLALEVRDGRWPTTPITTAAVATVASLAAVDVLHDKRWYVVLPLLPFVALIGAVAQSDLEGRRSWLRHPWLVRLGQWSFALYLLHWPALIVFAQLNDHHFASTASSAAVVVVLLAAVTALSALVFTCWERPWERRLRPQHTEPVALRSHP